MDAEVAEGPLVVLKLLPEVVEGVAGAGAHHLVALVLQYHPAVDGRVILVRMVTVFRSCLLVKIIETDTAVIGTRFVSCTTEKCGLEDTLDHHQHNSSSLIPHHRHHHCQGADVSDRLVSILNSKVTKYKKTTDMQIIYTAFQVLVPVQLGSTCSIQAISISK